MGPNFYELLGLDTSATPEAIYRAWRAAAALNHPDLHAHDGGDDDGFYTDLMARINVAYLTLGDATRRRAYDLAQGLLAATCSLCGGRGRLRSASGQQVVAACDSCWDAAEPERTMDIVDGR